MNVNVDTEIESSDCKLPRSKGSGRKCRVPNVPFDDHDVLAFSFSPAAFLLLEFQSAVSKNNRF